MYVIPGPYLHTFVAIDAGYAPHLHFTISPHSYAGFPPPSSYLLHSGMPYMGAWRKCRDATDTGSCGCCPTLEHPYFRVLSRFLLRGDELQGDLPRIDSIQFDLIQHLHHSEKSRTYKYKATNRRKSL